MENDLFLFNYPQQMGHLSNRTTHGRRVRTLDNLIQLAQAQTADDLFLISRTRNRAAVILDSNLRRAGSLFLRRFHALLDCQRNLARLARAKADMARFIAHDDQRRERQVLSAFHNLGDAIDRNDLILQIESLRSYSLFGLSHLLFSLALASLAAFPFPRFGLAAASTGSLSFATASFSPAASA